MALTYIKADRAGNLPSEHSHLVSHPERVQYCSTSGHISRPQTLKDMSDDVYHGLGRRATWKMDVAVMPALIIIYIMNFLDRMNIAAAALAGIVVDLHLSTAQYQTCVGVLFVGYFILQIPSNMAISRIKTPNRYICIVMAFWGLMSASMATVQSYHGLLITRFLIGFTEAAFFPAALFYLSLFYNREQYALRSALLCSGAPIGNAFGSLIAIVILKLDGLYGIVGWRWLFLIEGVTTIILAILFLFVLPPSIAQMKHGLSDLEREWLLWNMELDGGQQDDVKEGSIRQGFVMAISDPKTWLLMVTAYMIYIAAAVTNFFPSVMKTLGYSRTVTYFLVAPPYLLSVPSMLIIGRHSDKTRNRYTYVVGPMTVCVFANALALSTLNTTARYMAMTLLPSSTSSAATIMLSWVAGSLTQPKVKRATAIALINCICNTANIWCGYLYSHPPRYSTAFATNIVAAICAIVFATVTKVYLQSLNRKMDKGCDLGLNGPTEKQIAAGFRYML